jgi:protein involved in polysaccharide export with SLBB domain
MTLPVSNDYLIWPGDELKILMWGRLDSSLSLEVNNEGVINFPKVGPLIVAGLTFGEVKELIRVKAEAMTGVNVNVSMGKLRTIQVFVLGEVKSPGVFTVGSLSTVVNALLASGGPTPLGSLRKVEHKRQGKRVTTLDLYD